MARRLLGTAVTDENGEATFEYVGEGAGELHIVAESGTFSSNVIVVDDYTPIIASATITSDKNIIQSGSSANLTIIGKDKHNELVNSDTFDLCEQFIISKVSVDSTGIVQSGNTLDIKAKVKTSLGGVPNNVPVVFKKGEETLNTVQTSTNGVATYGYTGSGVGQVNITAECDGVVSETLPVFDCYKKDTGMSDYTDIWSIANATLSRDGGYSTITESTTGTTGIVGIRNVSLINYRIEVDVYQVDGTRDEWALQVVSSDYQDITSANAKLGEWKHISLDVTDAPINTRVRLATGGSCTKLRFKNFMVYPNGYNDVISINASNPVIQSTETTNITGSLFLNGVLQKNTNIDVYKNGSKVDTISTGSTGGASYTYTGSGAGATEFQFKYGSILSEIFVIKDCIYYDPVTSDTTANYYFNTTNNSITYDGEYIVITSKVTGTEQLVDLRGLTDDLKGKTVNVEFEVDTNGITGLVLRTLNLTPLVSTSVVDGVNTLENVVIPSDASGVIFRLIKSNSTSGQSFKFKNVKIYPV